MEMLHGQIAALYLFDVAEATDLTAAAAAISSSRAQLAPKPATPAYVRYQQPPLWFEGAAVDIPSIGGFRAGFKVFDYGVVSLRLLREFHGTWPELADASDQLIENEALERPLSRQERDEILRLRISYLANDLVIPTWNAAFVYDTPAGTQAALEIVEFANSQLLQFRDYDELLDNALASIYANIKTEGPLV